MAFELVMMTGCSTEFGMGLNETSVKMSDQTEWPREIWMREREKHDQGVVTAVLSEAATIARWDGDAERDAEFHHYVDGDIYNSAERYYKDRIAAITARNFKIKKLEWVTPSPTTEGQWQDTTGVYDIEDGILFIGHVETGVPHASDDEAKAAAQDHYERHVMAALDFAGEA